MLASQVTLHAHPHRCRQYRERMTEHFMERVGIAIGVIGSGLHQECAIKRIQSPAKNRKRENGQSRPWQYSWSQVHRLRALIAAPFTLIAAIVLIGPNLTDTQRV
jgi:hypothetical protein